jgi:ribosome-associated protein
LKQSAVVTTTPLNEAIVFGILEKKGKNVVILDLRQLKEAVADWFILCEGDSSTQVRAIADSVSEEVKKVLGERPWHVEGSENAQWVLLDYVNTVVHVFQPATRAFYGLENLWSDAEKVSLPGS